MLSDEELANIIIDELQREHDKHPIKTQEELSAQVSRAIVYGVAKIRDAVLEAAAVEAESVFQEGAWDSRHLVDLRVEEWLRSLKGGGDGQ